MGSYTVRDKSQRQQWALAAIFMHRLGGGNRTWLELLIAYRNWLCTLCYSHMKLRSVSVSVSWTVSVSASVCLCLCSSKYVTVSARNFHSNNSKINIPFEGSWISDWPANPFYIFSKIIIINMRKHKVWGVLWLPQAGRLELSILGIYFVF